jgi:Bacteriocin-protection, YdeI or OmpD-Associated/Domain of unknown function (DUF1905)
MIKFKSQILLLEHLPGMHYVFIPSEIIQKMGGSFSKRCHISVNQKVRWQGGFMALGEGNAYISISKKRMKEAGVELNDFVDVLLEEDNSEYGMDVPEELVAVFADDSEGFDRFEALSQGKKRYIINYVATVKSQEKRIERALLLIGNLKKLPRGKEDFRQMLGLPPSR